MDRPTYTALRLCGSSGLHPVELAIEFAAYLNPRSIYILNIYIDLVLKSCVFLGIPRNHGGSAVAQTPPGLESQGRA